MIVDPDAEAKILRSPTSKPLQQFLTKLSRQVPRGRFWLYFTGALFFNFGFSVFYFLFNLYLIGTGFSERSLGFIGSFMALGGLCGTLPSGFLAERIGLRWTLMGVVALTCSISVMHLIVAGVPAHYALAILSGFAISGWGVCLSPVVAGLTNEEQRPTAFSLTFASGIGVGVLGGLAAGYLPSIFLKYPSIAADNTQAEKVVLLLAIGVASLALIPLSRISVARPVRASARRPFVRLPSSFLRRFLIAMGVWGLVTGALPPFANVYFVRHLGLSLQAMGSIFSLSQLVQFCAILLAPLLFRALGATRGVVTTQLLTAFMLSLLVFAHGYYQTAWIYCAYITAQYMNEPTIYSLLMDRVDPIERNSASSYTFFIGAASRIVASAATGFSLIHFGYPSVLAGIALLAVLSAVLFWRVLPSQTRTNAITIPSSPDVSGEVVSSLSES